jgi:hypothetical protein
MTGTWGNIKAAQSLQADANSAGPKGPGKDITEEATDLKLISFAIEVETDPVTLPMQTDKGPFSVEIPKDQLSHLVYALRLVIFDSIGGQPPTAAISMQGIRRSPSTPVRGFFFTHRCAIYAEAIN